MYSSFTWPSPPLYLTPSCASCTQYTEDAPAVCQYRQAWIHTNVQIHAHSAWVIPTSRLLCKLRPGTCGNCISSCLSTPSNFQLLDGAYTFFLYVFITATCSFKLKLLLNSDILLLFSRRSS